MRRIKNWYSPQKTPWKTLLWSLTIILCLIIPLAVFGLGVLVALAFNLIKLAFD